MYVHSESHQAPKEGAQPVAQVLLCRKLLPMIKERAPAKQNPKRKEASVVACSKSDTRVQGSGS